MHQSIPAAPSLPRATAEHLKIFCSARGPGICHPRGYSRAFDTHAVSYQNITTQRILLEKKQIGSSVKLLLQRKTLLEKTSHIKMLKMALFDFAINEKCCSVDGGPPGGYSREFWIVVCREGL